jgi:heme-degrading monooxygenase HmoA
MPHARVVIFTFKPGTADEAAEKAEREVLPLLRSRPGFIHYTLAKSGNDTLLSFSMWESKRQAEEANHAAASWVQENLRNILLSVDRHIGQVAFTFPPAILELPLD